MRQVSLQLLNSLIEKLPDGIAIVDKDYRYLVANSALAEINGISVSNTIGKRLQDVVPELAGEVSALVAEVLLSGEDKLNVRVEGKTASSDNHRVWLVDYKGLSQDSERLVMISTKEVTELEAQKSRREHFELKLRASEGRFREVVDKTNGGLVIFNRNGVVQYSNLSAIEYITDNGLRKNTPQSFYDWFQQCDQRLVKQLVDNANGNNLKIHVKLHRNDGEFTPIEMSISIFGNHSEGMFLATMSDLSELAKSNAKLSTLLEEKTALLNEVHHRVKNNLQVISSLLNLHGHFVDDNTASHFQMCQQRVRAMALVHQLLYESDDISSVNVGLYMRKLCGLLQESFCQEDDIIDAQVVRYELPDESIWLEVKKMVPFGFIITEFITNSLKHGVKENGGELRLSLEKRGANIVVTVADSGCGVSEEKFFESQSLGNKLIDQFKKQLGASLEIKNETGAAFILSIPV